MYAPVNPNFTISKWGVRGSTLHRLVSMMHCSGFQTRSATNLTTFTEDCLRLDIKNLENRANQVMLTICGRLITPLLLGSMSVGLNILICHLVMDLMT